ncbi:Rab1a [Hexamita inflata]|uniref:Rab1a n=1 Tax=Hexamita inflata TaxID=28002 RepID=A0AA86PPZ3_9EUKA|nr:Rab1a [Hexamita inflata]
MYVNNSSEREVKIVILGETFAGKTSILYRYVSDSFYEQPASTITASFYRKKIYIQNAPVNLQLWDTAGQEKFQSITPLYYRTADIIFVVFAVDSVKSLERALHQIQEVRENKPSPNIVLLGNKSDLVNTVQDQALGFASSNNFKLYFVSALNGNGVKEAFAQEVANVIANKNEGKKTFKLVKEAEDGKGCC